MKLLLAGVSIVLGTVVYLCDGGDQVVATAERAQVSPVATRGIITPIAAHVSSDPRREALGDRLFHDQRLSRDATVSCASCHVLSDGGDDGRMRSLGVDHQRSATDAPTVYNCGLNLRQFWDGRVATLEDQVGGPVHNPLEMDTDWPSVVAALSADASYRTEFAACFPDGITATTIAAAIAEFERSLATPGAPFDRFLLGDAAALTPRQAEGWRLFREVGCVSCHQGRGIGGNMYQRFGIFGDYFSERGGVTDADLGRYTQTRDEADRHVFKVPSLRNVALTAPYLHDGTARTLEAAIEVMALYQLDERLDADEVAAIADFLGTLTGDHPRMRR
ncbi:MAG: c-type cytochrome [Planctomycetes bacterium]|nr:c-type cytochrome [Planctomycetota bacterium]